MKDDDDDDSGYSLLDDLFQHKNNEVQVTPTLQFSSAQLWFCPGQYLDNMEASALCQALGYGCGMVNYTQIQRNNTQQYDMFVNLSCPSPSLSSCSMHLTTSCPVSSSPLSLTCLPPPQCSTKNSTP